jgi:hypothetical protein
MSRGMRAVARVAQGAAHDIRWAGPEVRVIVLMGGVLHDAPG